MKHILLPIAIIAFSGAAMAHPHKTSSDEKEASAQRVWPFFGKSSGNQNNDKDVESLSGSEFANKLEKRFESHFKKIDRALKKAEAKNDVLQEDREIRNAEDLRDAAQALEDLISESGVISSFADMMLDLAEDFEMESTDDGLTVKFDGERIGRLKVKRDKHSESAMNFEGFGRNMTIEKEVIKRDGKTKTRIIIEVDGDEAFDIDLKPEN